MSILRSAIVMAVVGVCSAPPAAWAEDLAGTVAAKLRESGALAGYRVNVKAKSGTVWLEGRVADQKQLSAAVGIAENTPGVERVVNRLAIGGKNEAPKAAGALGVPASAWGAVGLATPGADRAAASRTGTGVESRDATADSAKTAPRGLLAFGGQPESPVKLAQALTPTSRSPAGAAGQSPAAQPRPLPLQAARPPVAGRQGVQPAGGRDAALGMRGPVQRTSLKRGMQSDPMHLPAPGGYEGPVADGQMVPGSMRIVEGGPVNGMPADMGYAAGGQGIPGAPRPMGGTGVGMPPIPGRSDGPNVPNYAWPSYASSPNIATVQYPTQYSPTAWPYIGPFYPYPQVPLGWRRVSLEWDDGWWWLDFDERHIHSHHR